MTTPSRELLIVAPERWDEACFSVPAVRALAGSGLGIGVLCMPYQKGFWQTLPGLEVQTELSEDQPWQVALMWEDGPLTKMVRKAKIQKRLGPVVEGLTKHLTETLNDSPHVTAHRVQYYLRAVAEMGVETAKAEYFSPVHTMEPAADSPVLLVPDSDYGRAAEWPLERWWDLCEILDGMQLKPTIAHMGQSEGLDAALCAIHGDAFGIQPIDLGEPNFDELAQWPIVISADGSLPHLASHLGSTCVTLFGPNDAVWKRPLGKRHAVVKHHVECAPCLLAKCPLDLRCQKELKVEKVIGALKGVTGSI